MDAVIPTSDLIRGRDLACYLRMAQKRIPPQDQVRGRDGIRLDTPQKLTRKASRSRSSQSPGSLAPASSAL